MSQLIRSIKQLKNARVGMQVKFEQPVEYFTPRGGEPDYGTFDGEITEIRENYIAIVNSLGNEYRVQWNCWEN